MLKKYKIKYRKRKNIFLQTNLSSHKLLQYSENPPVYEKITRYMLKKLAKHHKLVYITE